MLELCSREQCEQLQMMRFGVSCATCERLDEECPWHRQDEPELVFVSENGFLTPQVSRLLKREERVQ